MILTNKDDEIKFKPDGFEEGNEPAENQESQSIKVEVKGPDAETEETETEVDWEEEANRYKDLYIRGAAELENLTKRLTREKENIIKFANEKVIADLLPVVDNLDRAVEHGENNAADQEGLFEGVKMTLQAFSTLLDKFGVKQVSALGETFDPNFHEAVLQEENSGVENNTILKEIQKGYLLRDRLIRPAMVVVSKKASE